MTPKRSRARATSQTPKSQTPKSQTPKSQTPKLPSSRRFVLGGVLAGLVALVYLGSLNNDFINLDDNIYVTDNPMVQRGLTGESIAWAFTSGHATNWHPVTWLSHMVDIELFGLNPRGHHAMALLLHLLNTVLLGHVLFLMTGALWRSVAVAALFGLHPLHVESVAWVAERKDVLSTFFFLLTLWAYTRTVHRPSLGGWGITLGLFALGLMAKPMLITLPVLLIVLDYWPLARKRPLRQLVLEKVPLLVMAVVSTAITYAVQSRGGAVTAAESLPFAIRAGNAFLSYLRYLGKMVVPVDLAVFYPHPGLSFQVWKGGVAAVIVLALTALAVQQVKRRPYLLVGWLWYLGTLLPVLGFVQAGGQSMADRYTYIPLIGIFIMLAWGAAELIAARPGLRLPVIVTASAVTLALCALTIRQVEFWKDSLTLFTHSTSVTGPNWMAEQNLGFANGQIKNYAQAVPHYEAALRLRPGLAEVHRALGISLAALGRPEDAFRNYEEALRINPDYAEGHYDYAVSLAAQGRLEDAVRRYHDAIRLQPTYPKAYNNLGVALAMLGRPDDALAALTRALEQNPHDPSVHNNLGNLAATQGRMEEAKGNWREALRLDPANAEARRNLERAGR